MGRNVRETAQIREEDSLQDAEQKNIAFEQLETVIVNIEGHLNNRPLTFVGSGKGEEQVLTPNRERERGKVY